MYFTQVPASTVERPEKRYLEVLATLRTVFDLAESVCDGCQIWGPKAAFSTAAKGIKALQVRESAVPLAFSRSYRVDDMRERGEHRRHRGSGAEDSRPTRSIDGHPTVFCISGAPVSHFNPYLVRRVNVLM
jgi:hypothetical protein